MQKKRQNNYTLPYYLKERGVSSDLFLVVVEGRNTEKIYFEQLKSIKNRNSNIKIETVSAEGGDIERMLKIARDRIKKSRNIKDIRNAPIKKAFLIIDRDRFLNNMYSGIGLDSLRKGIESIGPKEPIEIIVSAPSFEYWYLLHFCDSRPANYDKIILKLEGFLRLKSIIPEQQSYSKKEDEVNKMLKKFLSTMDIKIAIENAEKISTLYEEDGTGRLDRDPYTEVHRVIRILQLDKR